MLETRVRAPTTEQRDVFRARAGLPTSRGALSGREREFICITLESLTHISSRSARYYDRTCGVSYATRVIPAPIQRRIVALNE